MTSHRTTTAAADLAAAVHDYFTAADGPSGDAEHDAALELAYSAEVLLHTRTVRVIDSCARQLLNLGSLIRRYWRLTPSTITRRRIHRNR